MNIGVIPTDTLYGIVGSALNPEIVERIYHLRKRTPDKPMIILISSIDDLKLFGITLNEFALNFLEKNWPNPLSVILPCPDEKLEYLHRGTKTLAFRMPKDEKLLEFLRGSGPLVAPSANFEGEKPAETIEEARAYFGDNVDLYIDNGKLSGLPSTLVSIENNQVKILRQGTITPLLQ
jgi:L-threonylcarbamoyladenylate synthase